MQEETLLITLIDNQIIQKETLLTSFFNIESI